MLIVEKEQAVIATFAAVVGVVLFIAFIPVEAVPTVIVLTIIVAVVVVGESAEQGGVES